jgi:hypothetical protein
MANVRFNAGDFHAMSIRNGRSGIRQNYEVRNYCEIRYG